MNTNALKKLRQLNVQQQNALTEMDIRESVMYWRAHALPPALLATGQANGVDWDHSIVLGMDIDFPGMPNLFGVLLTQDERFVRFEIDADETYQIVRKVELWRDITDQQNLGERNPGIGMGYGAICLKVLRELRTGVR